MREDEAGDEQVGQRELHEALQALIHRLVRAREIDELDELVQDDAARLNHREDQGTEDGQPSGIEREVLSQQGTEARLDGSAPGVFHRRKHRTGADFSRPDPTFDP
jgi:hypothetical protein